MSEHVGITAAIAACDRPDGLRRCVRGVLEGERLPDEIVIVDQSSHEAVAAAVRGLRPSVPLHYVRMPRRGLSASRNAAIARSTQRLIAFTDDDCVPDQRWIAAIGLALRADPGIAAVTGRVLPLGEERPGTYVVSLRTGGEARTYTGRVLPWVVGTGGNFAAWRGWLERMGGFDERLGAGSPGRAAEDADLLYRLLTAGARIRYEPSSIVYHERQTAPQRLASRRGYGYGIGAICARYLRSGDLFAVRMLGGYLADQGTSLARSFVHRDWFAARQRISALQGCAGGIVYGFRVPRA